MTPDTAARSGVAPFVSPSMKRALLNTGRACILLVTIYILVILRGESDIAMNLLLTAAAAFGIWLLFGRGSADGRLLVLYLIGFGLFAQLRSFGDDTGIPHQFGYVVHAETDVFGVLPSHWLQQQLYSAGHVGAVDVYCGLIYVSYFVALHLAALVVWRSRREWFPVFAGAALLILYVGLVASIAVPTAPPWLAGETGHTVAVSRVMQEVLARVSGSAYESGATAVGVNDVAAMPSLHTGITMLLALAAWRFDRRLGLLGFVYTASMGFTLVYFGEHYVMDVLAGAALAVVCWRLALRWWSPAAGRLNAGAERVATQASEALRPAGATAAAALDDTASAA